MNKLISILAFLIYLSLNCFGDSVFNEIGLTSSEIEKALQRMTDMDELIVAEFEVEPQIEIIARAIIFPELIRYNELIDKLQIIGNSISDGDIFNFSIGPFQIKPSFAKNVLDYKREFIKDGASSNVESIVQTANSLKDVEYALGIIHDYIDICHFYYPELKNMDMKEVVTYISTGYTFGFFENWGDVEEASYSPTWHKSVLDNSKKIPYSAVARFYLEKEFIK